jgi:hypothetical protein
MPDGVCLRLGLLLQHCHEVGADLRLLHKAGDEGLGAPARASYPHDQAEQGARQRGKAGYMQAGGGVGGQDTHRERERERERELGRAESRETEDGGDGARAASSSPGPSSAHCRPPRASWPWRRSGPSASLCQRPAPRFLVPAPPCRARPQLVFLWAFVAVMNFTHDWILLLPAAAEKYLAEESVTAARDSIEGPPVSRREYQYGPEYVAAVSLIVARWRGGTTADVIDRTR